MTSPTRTAGKMPQGKMSIGVDRMASFDRERLHGVIDDKPLPAMTASSVGDTYDTQNVIMTSCGAGKLGKGYCDEILSETYYPKYLGLHGADSSAYYECINDSSIPTLFLAPKILTILSPSTEPKTGTPLARTDLSGNTSGQYYLSAYPASSADVVSFDDYSKNETNHSVHICDYYYVKSMLEVVMDHIAAAADIIAAGHPEVNIQNVTAMLLYTMTHEAFALNSIDVWQDVEACRDVGCDLKEDLAAAFPGFADTASYMMWKSASLAMGSRLKQGYGPLQIIPSVIREAASNKEVAARFREHLKDDVLSSDDSVIRNSFDIIKAIYLRAMAIDNSLTRLERTVMLDKKARHPSTNYPFISDASTSRQLAFIAMAISLVNFPENYASAKNYLLNGPDTSALAMFYTIAELYDVKPDLAGIELIKMNNVSAMEFLVPDAQDHVNKKKISAGAPWEIRFVVPR